MTMYFDDFYEGYTFTTASKKLSKQNIISFAKKWDYQPFHLDENKALESQYNGLIASGWQTLLIAFTLILDTKKIDKSSMGSPGLENVNWFIPVRPNDVLHCKIIVIYKRLSKSKKFGIVKILVEIFNQENEIVSNMKAIWMLKIKN